MADWSRSRLKNAAFWIGATLAGLGLVAALFVTSGLYSVAASRGHFAITSWLLEFSMRRSVSTHSLMITVPPLDDPELIRLGAGHFHGGCAPCHGTPGESSNPVAGRMLPPPPPLAKAVTTWSNAELFWIVQNGIKYTGMPAWVALDREDEIWAMVAFLRALPRMTPQDYRTLIRFATTEPDRSAADLTRFGSEARAVTVCARCHDADSLPTVSRLVPVLAGQFETYLATALRQYANGSRKSGIMQPVAAELDEQTIAKLAAYYAGLSPPQTNAPSPPPREQIQRGQVIAASGIPAKGVPPCLACHGGSTANFPKLAGQHAAYIVGQLRLWRRGMRKDSTLGAIMAPIAQRLTPDQIDDVAAFFESLAGEPIDEMRGSQEHAAGSTQ
jgi:cytochrome c553